MSETTEETQPQPDSAVMRRSSRFGIDKPACKNCHAGQHETDGNHGEIDCGWWCSARDGEVEADQVCELWLPEFWLTPFAEELGGETLEEMDASMKTARDKYESAIRENSSERVE